MIALALAACNLGESVHPSSLTRFPFYRRFSFHFIVSEVVKSLELKRKLFIYISVTNVYLPISLSTNTLMYTLMPLQRNLILSSRQALLSYILGFIFRLSNFWGRRHSHVLVDCRNMHSLFINSFPILTK